MTYILLIENEGNDNMSVSLYFGGKSMYIDQTRISRNI